MEKLFEIAGTSVLNGTKTFRFATGKVGVRTTKLKHHGHTDVNLIQLPKPMTKADAMEYLKTDAKFNAADAVLPSRSGRVYAANEYALHALLSDDEAAMLAAHEAQYGAEAKLAAKRAADNARKRNVRAAAAAAKLAASVNPYTQIEVLHAA
jgi:hypothetical protein